MATGSFHKDLRRLLTCLLGCGLLLASAPGCNFVSKQEFAESPEEASNLETDAFLKVHTKKGELYVLETWRFLPEEQLIRGNGVYYTARRRVSRKQGLAVSYDEVALLESNRPELATDPGLITMGVVAAGTMGGAVFCAINPKACFGSCPTFYLPGHEDAGIQAEGFSASIARSLQEVDVDAFALAPIVRDEFTLDMRNEALETHMIASLAILAFPHEAGSRVLRAGSEFFRSRRRWSAESCASSLGDCKAQLTEADELRYRSLADDRDLATQEELQLRFPSAHGPRGLLIKGRNSLLNTFLFYQALAYLGSRAGERFVSLDQAAPDSKSVKRLRELGRLVADIKVEVRDPSGEWLAVGSLRETGPLAEETQVLALPAGVEDEGPLEVRLQMTTGYWKLDQVELVSLDEAVSPQRIVPTGAAGPRPDALEELLDPEAYLVTYPGHDYQLTFPMPDQRDYEVFLESEGYYYEWMRDVWLSEESSRHARILFTQPRRALRLLAPVYKAIEADAEEVFWRSRMH